MNNTISGDKLPFEVEDAKNVKVMSLDEVQSTVDVSSFQHLIKTIKCGI